MLIRQTVEAERETLRELVSDMLSFALEKALSPLTVRVSENGELLRSLQDKFNTQDKKIETLTSKTDSLQGSIRQAKKDADYCVNELGKLQLKMDEQEDRARRNNIRIVNLPPDIEGDDAAGYLRKMLPKWIPGLQAAATLPLEIDRAHRVYSANSSKPRTMILRLLRYPDRQAILQGARKVKPTLPDGTRLEFYADYSSGTSRRRNAFKSARARLRQKGIDSFLIYPATLRISVNGKKRSFESVQDLEHYLADHKSLGTSEMEVSNPFAQLDTE